MQRNQALLIFGLITVLGGTVWLLGELLDQRFQAGTVYPVYSTQRTDPLGARALLEALDRLPGVESQQNFLRLEKLEGSPNSTLVLLDVLPSTWKDGRVINGDFIEKYAISGGRVVISLNGQAVGWAKMEEDAKQRLLKEEEENRKKEEKKEKKKNEEVKDKDASTENSVEEQEEKSDAKEDKKKSIRSQLRELPDSLQETLGISLKKGTFVLTARGGYDLKVAEDGVLKQVQLPKWYSKSSIEIPNTEAGNRWKVLARVNDQAMIIERKLGSGSIVLCTDSYFASNEALWKEPSPEFLLWLTGERKIVIFDETHLGTRETPGIMHLANKFRMHGFFIGGIVLFGLFVWQSTASLVPAREDANRDQAVSGHGATAGLVSLLRRGIPKSKLLQKSFDTWEKSAATQSPAMKARLEQARSLLPADNIKLRKGLLQSLYRQISEALHTKRK